jgi:hypothetical protein
MGVNCSWPVGARNLAASGKVISLKLRADLVTIHEYAKLGPPFLPRHLSGINQPDQFLYCLVPRPEFPPHDCLPGEQSVPENLLDVPPVFPQLTLAGILLEEIFAAHCQ